jgi:hypothetical protein
MMERGTIPFDRINPALLEILLKLELGEASPWAVLLCKFADDSTDVAPREHYERLFTSAGDGSSNMVDFFRDVSHGKLNLDKSEVFGWYTLAANASEYAGNVAVPPPGQFNRDGLFDLCKQAATAAGVDLSHFSGVVASMAGAVDLFGFLGGMGAVCDSLSLKPSLLGQEMGHGYGLDHARRDGSEEEYADPWDVMSTANAFMNPESEYEEIGPGLNAASMRSRGWLDESRVWKSASVDYEATIELRPLHRRDLAGLLAAELGSYLVEFRLKEHWDGAIPRSCVLVHRFEGNHPYVMQGESGSYDLVAGDSFGVGLRGVTPHSALEVLEIDEGNRVAKIRLRHQPGARTPSIVGEIVGGVAVDGGGGIIVGGKFHPVPPREPILAMLRQMAAYLASEEIDDISTRGAGQRAAMEGIAQQALTALRDNDVGVASNEERPDAMELERERK